MRADRGARRARGAGRVLGCIDEEVHRFLLNPHTVQRLVLYATLVTSSPLRVRKAASSGQPLQRRFAFLLGCESGTAICARAPSRPAAAAC